MSDGSPRALELDHLTKRYRPSGRPALQDVCLALSAGERVALLGESGSGKTTLLRTVAGLERPTAGSVTIHGTPVTGLAPERRNVALVFQEALLFPHMTVRDNVAFGLVGQPRARIRGRATELMSVLGIGELESRYPHEISGGEAQRVALARALAPRPALLLMDEPFNSLDHLLRTRLVREVRETIERTATPALLVTHDRADAFAFADRVAVLREGHMEQMDSPERLYREPATPYVACLLGSANLLPARQEREGWVTALGAVGPRRPLLGGADGRERLVCLRPSELELAPVGRDEARASVRGVVLSVGFQGEHREAVIRPVAPMGGVGELVVRVPPEQAVAKSEVVSVSFRG